MDSQLVNDICQQVYRAHPEVKGCRPKIQPYDGSGNLLIFQSKAKTEDGRPITHTIRVVVSAEGKIKKMSSSR